MVVLLNGSFGVGKTTVARELRRLIPGAVTMNPEYIGFVLQRLTVRRPDDFQDLAMWRRLTIAVARFIRRFAPTVIVPMAISDQRYLDEIRRGLGDERVAHFCLTAPLDVVRARLAGRGEPVAGAKWDWVHRRAAECCAAHGSDDFETRVETEGRLPREIAADLAARLRCATSC